MNRIVVLGSTGFLGKALRQKLSDENFNVKYMIHKKNSKLKQNEFYGDILDKKCLQRNIKNGDVVINLVGQINKDFSKFFDANLKGSLNLLEITQSKKNIKIIFASSINVYGENCKYPSKETDEPNPVTLYGIVKFLTEQLYQKFSKINGTEVSILRFSNLYGKNKTFGIITNIIKSTPATPVILTHNGNQQRDFLHVDDAVNGIIRVIKKQPKNFEIFNISSSNKVSLIHIIHKLKEISQKKIYYKLISEKNDEKCLWASNSKSRIFLNFNPQFSLNEGLMMTINHFEKKFIKFN